MTRFNTKVLSIIIAFTIAFAVFPIPISAKGGTTPTAKKILKPFPKSKTISTSSDKKLANINLTAISTIDSIKVSWDVVSEAISYDIEADGKVINVGLKNSYIHSNLKEGTVHTYRIRTNSIEGAGVWSKPYKFATKVDVSLNKEALSNSSDGIFHNSNININNSIKAPIPGMPTDINSVPTTNSIILIWRPVDGAAGYDIEVDGVVKDCGDKFTFTISGLLPETSHLLRIRAKNSSGAGEWSNYIKQATLAQPINAPQNIVNTATTNSITINWDKVNDATGYDIEIDGKVHDNGSSTSYTESSLLPGTAHAYRVRAKKNSNNGNWSTIFVKLTLTDTKTSSITNDSSKTDSSKNISNNIENSSVNNNLNRTSGSKVTDNGAPAAPLNLTAASETATTVNLTWTSSSNDNSIVGYDIYNGIAKIGSVSGNTNYTVTGLTPNTAYTFTVTAKDSAGNASAASDALTVSTKDTQAPTAVQNLTVTSITSTSLKLTWDASSDDVGVVGYDIYNGTTKIGSTTGDTNYTLTGLTPNTIYNFVVIAKDAAGNISDAGNTVTVNTLLAAITNISTASTDNSIGLLWNAVKGAIGYDVEVDGNIIDNGSSLYYINSGLANGSQHSYRVRAKSATGVGEWSSLMTITVNLSATTISSDTTLNSSMIYGNLTITNGLFDIKGNKVIVLGSMTQSGGVLNVDSGSLIIAGDYKITNGSNYCNAYLQMMYNADYVCVGGNFLTQSYNPSINLTAGTLEVKGNFTQKLNYNGTYANNFAPSGTHKVILSGSGTQTVSFDNPGSSSFNILEIRRTVAGGIVFASELDVNSLITNGYALPSIRLNSMLLKITEDEVVNGDINICGSMLDLNGHTLKVLGSVNQSGGVLNVDSGSLIISGDYKITNGSNYCNAYLQMMYNADYICVGGNFLAQSYNSSTNLTAGTLEVKGNFTQKLNYNGAHANNFAQSGTHKVILSGSGTQTVSFDNPGSSYFNILEIRRTVAGGIVFASELDVNSLITNGYALPSIRLNSMLLKITEDEVVNGDINICGSTLDLNGHTLKVLGSVNQSGGVLNVDSGSLIISGDYKITNGSNYCNAYLQMMYNADYVCVGGNFLAQSYNSSTNLTAGTLEVKGNFTQKLNYNGAHTNNFAQSGTHKVILSGNGTQTVSFDNPGSSYFNILEIRRTVAGGIVFASELDVNSLITNGYALPSIRLNSMLLKITEDEVVNGDINICGNTLDLYGHKLLVLGNVIQSGGTLYVDGGGIVISGDYKITNGSSSCSAYLEMKNSTDYVYAQGDFLMQSCNNHSNYLTAGILEVGGNFSQGSIGCNGNSGNFAASGTYKVILSGNKEQTVRFDNPNSSCFNILQLSNSGGIVFETAIAVNTLIGGGTINSSLALNNISTPLTDSYTIKGNLSLANGNLNIGSNTINVIGNLILSGGTLDLSTGEIDVDGTMIQTGGTLNINKGFLYILENEDFVTLNDKIILTKFRLENILNAGSQNKISLKNNGIYDTAIDQNFNNALQAFFLIFDEKFDYQRTVYLESVYDALSSEYKLSTAMDWVKMYTFGYSLDDFLANLLPDKFFDSVPEPPSTDPSLGEINKENKLQSQAAYDYYLSYLYPVSAIFHTLGDKVKLNQTNNIEFEVWSQQYYGLSKQEEADAFKSGIVMGLCVKCPIDTAEGIFNMFTHPKQALKSTIFLLKAIVFGNIYKKERQEFDTMINTAIEEWEKAYDDGNSYERGLMVGDLIGQALIVVDAAAGTIVDFIESGKFANIFEGAAEVVSKLKNTLKYSIDELSFQIKKVISIGDNPEVELVGGIKYSINIAEDVPEMYRPQFKEVIENIWKYSGKTADEIIAAGKNIVPNKGYETFKELKDTLGLPGDESQWHHIVEQSQIKDTRAGFAATDVNNLDNIISLPSGSGSIHSQVSGYYSSIQDFTNGLTVRDWLGTKSFDEQFKFGIEYLQRFGNVIPTSKGWVFNPF